MRKPAPRTRLSVEQLEDRTAPANLRHVPFEVNGMPIAVAFEGSLLPDGQPTTFSWGNYQATAADALPRKVTGFIQYLTETAQPLPTPPGLRATLTPQGATAGGVNLANVVVTPLESTAVNLTGIVNGQLATIPGTRTGARFTADMPNAPVAGLPVQANYTLKMTLDPNNALSDLNRADNAFESHAFQMVLPELYSVNMTANFGAAPVALGATGTVTNRVWNAGVIPARPFSQSYYLSADQEYSPGDVPLTPTLSVSFPYPQVQPDSGPDTGPGNSANAPVTHAGLVIPIPGGVAGFNVYPANMAATSATPGRMADHTLNLVTRVDSDNVVPEVIENNNSGLAGTNRDSVPIRVRVGPDLLAAYASASPTSAQWGQTASVTTQVRNLGLVASGGFRVEWYLSRNSTGSADDIRVNLDSGATGFDHANIPATGIGAVFTTRLRLPARPAGETHTGWWLVPKIDALNVVEELDEVNNFTRPGIFGAGNLTLTGPPDLVGEQFRHPYGPSYFTWGATISYVYLNVTNRGSAAGASAVQYFLSRDATGSADDVPLPLSSGGVTGPTLSIDPLAAASGVAREVQLRLPSAAPSGFTGENFHIVARVDVNSQVAEENENNNWATTLVGGGATSLPIRVVTRPDYRSTAFVIPDNGTPNRQWGQTVPVYSTLRNDALLLPGFSYVTNRLVLSRDIQFSPDDIPVPVRSSLGIPYSDFTYVFSPNVPTVIATWTATLPAARPAGWTGNTFYLLFVTDAPNHVAESNEANNSGLGLGIDTIQLTIT